MISNTLSLKEFVQGTLSEICEAVDAAREEHNYIAPKIYTDPAGNDKATVVDFDIAVVIADANSITDSKSGSVGGGLKISVLRAETQVSAEDEKVRSSNNSKETRIKFSVPVYFQFDEIGRERRLEQQAETVRRAKDHNAVIRRSRGRI